jgi:PAS domain S-box-containing protein
MQLQGSTNAGYTRNRRSSLPGKFGRQTVIALLAIALAVGAFFALSESSRAWVAHSRDVGNISRDARTLARDRRRSTDEFLASHDRSVAELDARTRRELTTALDSLATLTADNPLQNRRAHAIAAAVADWDSSYAAPVLAGTVAAARPGDRTGAVLFDAVLARFDQFIAAEDQLYDERLARNRFLGILTLVGTLLPIVVLAGLTVEMKRRLQTQTDALLDQQSQLEEQAIELENQVEELETSNSDLADANRELEVARKAAEHALEEHDRVDAFLESALASSPVGFGFLDSDLRYIRVNETLAAARGIPADEWIGRHVRDMASSPSAGASVVAGLEQSLATGEPVMDAAIDGVGPSGTPMRHNINYFPIRNREGARLGVGIITTNVTERTKLEEQFRQSQKMEALGRLASGVAHDFRNLLTVIRSYCDLAMLETAESDPRRRELVEIRGAADRAAVLARQLLSFGRPQPLLAVELDVNESVRAVETMLKHMANSNVKVETRLAKRLGQALVDPGHVEQVLMNLAINAIDAMPEGGRLTFETANVTLDSSYTRVHQGVAPGQYVMLSVSDTGSGMDEETLKRIFEPFFTTKPPGKGTGLGLSTVYGIVTQYSGHTWVYSEPGHGTTFKIYLPRIAIAGLSESGSGPIARREPVHAEYAQTVLVVEDDIAVRGSLSRILKKFGYMVLEAEHGADGLRVARSFDGQIHLAISDLMMPEMSGREFAQQLHALRPKTHILFMSGFTDEDVLTRGLVGAHQAFIQKPFAVEDITRKVHDVIREAV